MSAISKSIKQYSGFDPRYIPGCTLWLDGDDPTTITFSTGTSVATWKDKSVSANNATGATNKPTYSQPFISNGRNALYFNSFNSQYMTLDPTKLPTGLSSFTTFCVSTPQNDGTINNKSILTWGTLTSGNGVRYYFSGGSSNISYMTFQLVARSPITDTINVQNNYSIFGSTNSASAGTTTYRNGNLINGMATLYNIGTTVGHIGTYDGSSQFFVGAIGEILIYNRLVSITERQQIEGYLGWKWGLQASLPQPHPYYTTIKHGPKLSTFNPTDISGCVVWVDASDKTTFTLSGSTVLTLTDKSGGGVTGITLNGTPTWTSTGLDNKFPAFGTTVGAFIATLASPLTNFANTVFVVSSYVNLPNAGNCAVGFATSSTGSSTFYRAMDYASNPSRFRTIAFFASVYTTPGQIGGVASFLTPFLFSSTFTGTTPINNYYNAGTQTSTIAAASPPSNATHCMIGCDTFTFSGGVPGSFWTNGRISEVLVFNRALTDTERFTIDAYLCYKWKFSSVMPSNHIYKKFTPLKTN